MKKQTTANMHEWNAGGRERGSGRAKYFCATTWLHAKRASGIKVVQGTVATFQLVAKSFSVSLAHLKLQAYHPYPWHSDCMGSSP